MVVVTDKTDSDEQVETKKRKLEADEAGPDFKRAKFDA